MNFFIGKYFSKAVFNKLSGMGKGKKKRRKERKRRKNGNGSMMQ